MTIHAINYNIACKNEQHHIFSQFNCVIYDGRIIKSGQQNSHIDIAVRLYSPEIEFECEIVRLEISIRMMRFFSAQPRLTAKANKATKAFVFFNIDNNSSVQSTSVNRLKEHSFAVNLHKSCVGLSLVVFKMTWAFVR